MKYFKLSDFEYSETAIKKGIINKIPKETISNYEKFMVVLDEIRTELGKPIYINSGYRCAKLNKMVGGSKTSDHTFEGAAAADLDCRDIKLNKKLFDIISLKVKLHKLDINEVILEYGGK